ncbi:RNA polymerase sigma factor [Phenylobacterium soli]|uniref:RNA polymerase subunit sigma-70 n=1 Tax=Phenylobacterium soli TaxID=2170551 RepID=A0A328AJ76_9CAUL|nr:RNA polymerase sigma factor [Phenylobacterium soli]RAK54126.1 RNA polymerase subunit sigma-70 [Phenylobacterium soli]
MSRPKRGGATPPAGGPPPPKDGDSAVKPADAAVRRVLVECHRDMLWFLQRRLRNRQDAEDVLQTFVARALDRSDDLREIRSVRGWLSRILASTLADHQRRTARRGGRETAMDPADLEQLLVEPDEELDSQVCACLYRLLPTLKPAYAEVIWRIDLLDEPRDRVAASLGLTLNTINVRLHRGRQALRRRLEEICLTCPVHGFLDCRCEEAERGRELRDRLRSHSSSA